MLAAVVPSLPGSKTVANNLGGFPDSDKIIMIFVSTPQLTTGILNLIWFYFLYEL